MTVRNFIEELVKENALEGYFTYFYPYQRGRHFRYLTFNKMYDQIQPRYFIGEGFSWELDKARGSAFWMGIEQDLYSKYVFKNKLLCGEI